MGIEKMIKSLLMSINFTLLKGYTKIWEGLRVKLITVNLVKGKNIVFNNLKVSEDRVTLGTGRSLVCRVVSIMNHTENDVSVIKNGN